MHSKFIDETLRVLNEDLNSFRVSLEDMALEFITLNSVYEKVMAELEEGQQKLQAYYLELYCSNAAHDTISAGLREIEAMTEFILIRA